MDDLSALGWDAFFERSFAPLRADGLSPARIVREEKGQYLVYDAQGEVVADVTGKYRHEAGTRGDFPAVGDWVAIRRLVGQDGAQIHARLPRKSQFSRKVALARTEEQVIAANIDTVFLVTGLDQEFSLRRIERYVTAMCRSRAQPVIVLNKIDLCSDVASRKAQLEAVAPGIPVLPVSALESERLDVIWELMQVGRTVAFIGSSGVGKSTIINRLLGVERQKTGEASSAVGKGRHITTRRELILIPDRGMLVDTPGLRELQLWGDEQELDDAFEDIAALAVRCRFRDCRHLEEPGCAVRAALADGALDEGRLKGYLKMKKELRRLALRQHQLQRQTEKAERRKAALRSPESDD